MSCPAQLNSNNKKIFNEFVKYVVNKIPDTLFKYHAVDKYDRIGTLKKKKVRFANPENFNDKCDGLVSYDLKEDDKNYEKVFDKYYKKVVESKYSNNQDVIQNKGDLYNKVKSDIFEPLKEKVATIQIRNNYYVFCLSERHNNDKMWADYTNNGEGFCIGYDVRKILDTNLIVRLFSVYYANKKSVDFFEILYANHKSRIEGKSFSISYTELEKYILSLLVKKDEWKSEEEWRFLISKNNTNTQLIDFDCAVSIFLGEKISKKHEKQLIKIAKQQKLGVFKREFNSTKCEWEYNPI